MNLFRTPPFTRAPNLLRKHSTVAIAVFGASLILGLVAATAPLFISSASNAALAREIGSRCAGNVNGTLDNFAPLADAEREIGRAWSPTSTLGAPILTLPSPPVEIATTGVNSRKLVVRFLHRTGFEDNVEVLEQTDADGLWMSGRGAEQLGVSAGDRVEIVDNTGTSATLLIGTIFRDLNDVPRSDYWCPQQDYFIPGPPFGDLPPALVLVDDERFLELFSNLESAPYAGDWEFPVEGNGLTTQTAAQSIAEMEGMQERIRETFEPSFANSVSIATDLPFIVRRADTLGGVLRSSVIPIAAAAVISALGLLAAAGNYWVDRRRVEVTLLVTKGIGPGAVALKAVAEMATAVIAGMLLAWLLALVVAPIVGPAPLVDESARWEAMLATVIAGGIGLIAVAVVVAFRSARVLDDAQPRLWAGTRLPALLALTGATGLAWFSMRDGAIAVAEGDQVGRVSWLVLAFPLFLFALATLLAAEVLSRWLGRRGPAGKSRSTAVFLASRRIASSPTMALVLIAAAAFPVATLVYAASLSRSSSSTIDAKAKSFIGSDLAVAMIDNRSMPSSLAGSATQVTRSERAVVSGREVDIIGVDPVTFTDGAYWHDSFSQQSLDEVLELVSSPHSGASLRVVVANGTIDGGVVTSDRWGAIDVPVEVVSTIGSFPGMRGDRPLLITDRTALADWIAREGGGRLPGFRDWVYVRDVSEPAVVAAFGNENITFAWVNEADDVLDQLKYAVIIWTLDFIEIIAVLAALIVVAGVLLYGDARQRTRNLAYALARKMGLSRRSHLLAGFLELAVLLGLGLMVGAVAAFTASVLIFGGLDAVPTTPPGPRYIGALDVVVICAGCALALAAIGALLAQRTADRADTSEMLRHGG